MSEVVGRRRTERKKDEYSGKEQGYGKGKSARKKEEEQLIEKRKTEREKRGWERWKKNKVYEKTSDH